MNELVNRLMVRVVEKLVDYAQTKILQKKSGLYTEVDNPLLIQAVVTELRGQEAKMLLAKCEDLEKAIYHIAGKQQDMLLQQKELEKVAISTATLVEEMVNDVESSMTEDLSDDEFLSDAWGSKKKTATSTSN